MFSSQILPLEESTKVLVYLAGITVIINTFSDFFRAFFRAFEKMQWEAISKMAEGAFLVLIVGFLIFYRNADLKEIFYGYIIVGVLILILNATIFANKFFRKELFKKFSPDYKKIKLIFKESWPLTFLAVSVSISYYIDQIMLGIISTKTELGCYSSAQRIIHVLSVFNVIIVVSFLPKISYYFKENKKQLKLILNQLNKIIIAIAIPIGIGGTVFAPEIITFVFGNEYSRAIFALQILIWAQVIIFISTCYSNTLVMCDRQKDVMYGVGLGAIINVILNYIFISKYSLYGASVATVITQLIIFVYIYRVINKKIVKIEFYKYLTKPILASLTMMIVLLFLKTNFSVLVLILSGIIFYSFVLFKVLKFKI
jgi:O-antigen/teichoic acid export membrane protein